MFEITRNNDDERLEYFVNERMAYKGAIYDFTFEGRFLVYHTKDALGITYYAIDKITDLTSEVTRTQKEYQQFQYPFLIQKILKSIRYTGDRRNLGPDNYDPADLIDAIFRVMMPSAGFAIREEQINLCKQMYYGLKNEKVSICEAEVGTGKSMAYLVAAFVAAYQMRRSIYPHQTVTITTSSIELQKALIEKEIPTLSKVLMNCGFIDDPLTAVLRKGKDHYLCPARYQNFLDNITNVPGRYDKLIPILSKINIKREVIDMDALFIPNSVKQKICVGSGCKFCPQKYGCKYHQFVKYATSLQSNIDFQVTNHNMFLMSYSNPSLLKDSRYVIIDEAHKLRDAAVDVFGTRLCEKSFQRYFDLLQYIDHPGLDDRKWNRHCQRAEVLCQNLFAELRKQQDENDCEIGRGSVIKVNEDIMNRIDGLIREIRFIDRYSQYRKSPYYNTARNLVSDLSCFTDSSKLITWVETDENGDTIYCCSLKDNSAELLNKVWKSTGSFILTSGTMSDGRSFEYFKKENGISKLPELYVREMSCPSPFDYQQHTRLYIPTDLPLPNNDSEQYLKEIGDRIVSLVKAANGHTAILFTSYKVLYKVFELTKDRLSDYDLFMMSRANRTAISDFKKSKNGVLFASGCMWEGVDCVGDVLSSVIIVRLPFPLRSTLMEEKKAQSKNVQEFIQMYAVPEMLIKLRQGVGRLIRSENDTGVVTILDARAASGIYAIRIREALRKYPCIRSMEQLETFLHQVKKSEFFLPVEKESRKEEGGIN